MLKLLLGTAGSGKTGSILAQVCENSKVRRQIIIVPEQQSHQVERLLSQVGAAEVSLHAEVLSFSRLANRVFQSQGGLGEEELDSGGRILLMYEAIKQLSEQLVVFRKAARRPAFLQSLLSTSDELKRCCIKPEQLISFTADERDTTGDRLHEIGLICARYDALTEHLALDPTDRLTRAQKRLENSNMLRDMDIYLDGFTDFTPQQAQLIYQLLLQANEVTVTLTCDGIDKQDDAGIFSTAIKTAHQMLRLAKRAGAAWSVQRLEANRFSRPPALQLVQEQLFADELPQQKQSCYGQIELMQADDPRGEVEWAAMRILQLVQQGCRFRDIEVVCRNFADYQDLIETIFPSYNIPVFSSAMTQVLQRPVLALVLAALDTVTKGYQYEDIFRYLKTGLTDIPSEQCDILENYVLQWNIRGSRWTQKSPWQWHPKGYGFSLEDEDKTQLAQLETLRRSIVQPLEKMRRNPNKTGRGQAISLYTFLQDIKLDQQLQTRMERLYEQEQPVLADEYRQLWEILCNGLQQCAQLLGEDEVELEEFARLFALVLSQYSVGSIPPSLDRVTAGEMTRQTGQRVKAVILLGAEDASLPRQSQPTGLLTDEDREFLTLCGLEVGDTSREALFREMTTIYLTCAKPSEYLLISYPSVGRGGGACAPSFFVQRLCNIFSDLDIHHQQDMKHELYLCAPKPALTHFATQPKIANALRQIPHLQTQLQRLEQARACSRGSLSRESVRCLYGEKVRLSATRMEKMKSCHFSYFLQYGLKLKARKRFSFAAPEYGTFVHYVLEYVLHSEVFTSLKNTEVQQGLDDGAKQVLKQLTTQAIETYVQDVLGGLAHETPRFQYLFSRLKRAVQEIVLQTVQELLCSAFEPIEFELSFGEGGEMPAIELTEGDMTISVSGFVDRVDGWVHDGRVYLRVVDYKTGKKSFDLTEVFHGLGLQMLLYLFALEKNGTSRYKMPVTGTGVLYLPAREPVIRAERTIDEKTWQKEYDKQLVRSGLLLDEPEILHAMEHQEDGGFRFLPLRVSSKTGEITGKALASAQQFGKLDRHIQQVLKELCREMSAGEISADPLWRGEEQNPCRYCEYVQACQFEQGRGGDTRRWIQTISQEQLWQQIDEKLEQS